MQFKHPELLYALFLLLIPIIIHLFQLRRFQKIAFTNVHFLKNVIIQTRKSSQLKRWLTLLIRLFLFAAIILAFAQPYTSKTNRLNLQSETIIYLDNSFSMEAKGEKGPLLMRSIQDIISNLEQTTNLSLYTNDLTLKDATHKTITNALLNLDYSSNQLDYNAVLLKGKKIFSKETATVKNLILLSDFQQNGQPLVIDPDASIDISLVQLQPLNTANVSIDSVYISKVTASHTELTVKVNSHNSSTINDVSISLFNNENLIAKSSVDGSGGLTTTFTLANNEIINGKITIDDVSLQFDNVLYFNINKPSKINVLSINAADDDFLKRVFTDDEFDYKTTAIDQLNYNDIEDQNLIVLNEIDNIPVALSNALSTFKNDGGHVLIIPSEKITLNSYNQFFKASTSAIFQALDETEKKVTTINYAHPIFDEVFDKKISNFQYPKVNSYYTLNSNNDDILKFEDGKPFLIRKGQTYVFAAALNKNNSNFTSSPLIVPTLYNIGRQSLQLPRLYYNIGTENHYDIHTTLQQDDILKLKKEATEIIPQQRTYSNKVSVITNELPIESGIYQINKSAETLEHISYNYNRSESNLNYFDLSTIDNASVASSIPQVFNTIKSNTNINALWKWFTIFALVLLIIELLILKYFK